MVSGGTVAGCWQKIQKKIQEGKVQILKMRKIAFLQIQYGSEKDPNKFGGKKFSDNAIKKGDGQKSLGK
jgi:hypothetical protein